MAEGFKMGSAFVDVDVKDNTDTGRRNIGSSMAKWAGGLALGTAITKGITDNLDVGQATAKLAGQLNLTKDVADKAGRLAGEVYRDNFGESIPEVNAAIGTIGQSLVNLNTVSDAQLKQITEGVLGLSSTFDVDLGATVEATRTLITNKLAPDATSAMDLMTRAFQTGGNSAGDLLETITEYAPYFHNLGLDGATALGLLSQGLKAGARDTDFIADAFKEFGIRAIDGSTAVSVAFDSLGMKTKDMMDAIAGGGPPAQEALLSVLRGLQNMEDPVQRNLTGVALFGTQWEDTLRQILPSMDLTEAALTDVTGATDKMNKVTGDTAAGGIESVKRKMEGWVQSMTNADGPLGDISSWALGSGEWVIPLMGNIGMIIAGFTALSGTVVGSWIAMALAAMGNAVIMAASWLIAFWPIALIVAAVAALVYLVVTNWDAIRTATVDTWNAIWKFVSDVVTAIVTAFQVALDMVDQKWDATWRWVSDRISWIVDAFHNGVQWIVDAWDWLGTLPGKFRDWMQSVIAGASNKLGELVDWFKSLPGRILNALGDLGNLLVNIGKKIIQGFLNGLKNAWEGVKNFVSSIGSWIADHKGPIEVDAVLLTPHGRSIMDGLQKGLRAEFDATVKPTIAGMAGEIANTAFTPPRIGPTTGTATDMATVGGQPAPSPDDAHGQGVRIDNLTITFPGSLNAMNKTDLRAVVDFLSEELRKLGRGRVVA